MNSSRRFRHVKKTLAAAIVAVSSLGLQTCLRTRQPPCPPTRPPQSRLVAELLHRRARHVRRLD
ncbi:MAG: hypothetical protein JF922_15205 [Candidatus Dormibacteraeota bacterium]|uniref:Uncharacterized protein n=1 Tax=Candidatus Nephthysia bennettiae TaxID=3127016 RepID=A0A934K0Q1_9BACT|nr:hypothetical protein [Candidatus Dormibacteraeota bacterium]